MELDHLAVAATDLDEGRAWVEETLGVAMQPGGKHAIFGTQNVLLGLEDGIYMEVITVDPAAPAPGRPRWFNLDAFTGRPRPGTWICRTDDLDGMARRFPGIGTPVSAERGNLRWRMAVPADGLLPYGNLFPAVMQWDCDDHPARRLTPSGCRLRRLVVCHPQAPALQSDLAPVLEDARIVFESGPAALRLEMDTPHGPRVLE